MKPTTEELQRAVRDIQCGATLSRGLEVLVQHPDWNTPNWCNTCSPRNQGYCSCERACND